MTESEIRSLVARLDTAKAPEQDAAWVQLRPLGEAVVPFLAEAFPGMKKWQGRVALVFHAIKYARASEAAFRLGVLACHDRATRVRYRACGLLAYSQKPEALPHLQALLRHDSETVEDARAAIDAIVRRNHHYFVDRTHSGCLFWEVAGATN